MTLATIETFKAPLAIKDEHNTDGWMIEGMHYRFDPQGSLPFLKEVYSQVKKPILVTEIGCTGPTETKGYHFLRSTFTNTCTAAGS